MLVRSRMTPDVKTVSPETTLAEALSVCRTHRIRHLPVVSGDRLVGLVTDRDLRLAVPPVWADRHEELQEALRKRTVGELMTSRIISASPDLPVEEAGKLLYENRIGCLPILEDNRLIGILTETDLLRAFVELFGTAQPSSRVEVRMANKPGELSRVVRVIGIEHRINITGLVLPPTDSSSESIAIMHLATLHPGPIVEALRKLGYTVGWPSLDLPQADTEVTPGMWSIDHMSIHT